MDKKSLAKEVLKRLSPIYKNPKLDLEFDSPFELLVEAILAAQEKDEKINSLRKSLFSKFKSPKDIANAPIEEIEKEISSVSFFRKKAKTLKDCCEVLVREYNGSVPDDEDSLVKLPGVGKKTANMVIGAAFNKPAIAVDRHVERVSQRLSLSDKKDPDKIQEDLKALVEKENWTKFYLLLLRHGKEVCTAKNPKCKECVLKDICPSSNAA